MVKKLTDNVATKIEIKKSKFIIIPLVVVNDVRLTPVDKLVYGLIYSLSQKTGCCIMGNYNLTQILPYVERTVKKSIGHLYSLGFINKELIRAPNNNSIVGRKLYPQSEQRCVFDSNCSVDKLIRKDKKEDACDDDIDDLVVNSTSPNKKPFKKSDTKRNCSYSLEDICKIDTLDFLDQ